MSASRLPSHSPSPIAHIPISESREVTRRRQFRILSLRPDFRDVVTQLVIMFDQLHNERFTGSQTFNWSGGTINNVNVVESKKIDPV